MPQQCSATPKKRTREAAGPPYGNRGQEAGGRRRKRRHKKNIEPSHGVRKRHVVLGWRRGQEFWQNFYDRPFEAGLLTDIRGLVFSELLSREAGPRGHVTGGPVSGGPVLTAPDCYFSNKLFPNPPANKTHPDGPQQPWRPRALARAAYRRRTALSHCCCRWPWRRGRWAGWWSAEQ